MNILFLIYIIVVTVMNVGIFLWTRPHGGYGALGAMVVVPVANIICLLVFLISAYIIRRVSKEEQPNYTPLFIGISTAVVVIFYILIETIYEHSGC